VETVSNISASNCQLAKVQEIKLKTAKKQEKSDDLKRKMILRV